ncbi:hypothetical protein K438DRAFT_2104131 [Mycena galopus ATCC 62051]|nr:hypothetical protein K438DRAFT_2104131 [Mycena galopus ATCC 62051]
MCTAQEHMHTDARRQLHLALSSGRPDDSHSASLPAPSSARHHEERNSGQDKSEGHDYFEFKLDSDGLKAEIDVIDEYWSHGPFPFSSDSEEDSDAGSVVSVPGTASSDDEDDSVAMETEVCVDEIADDPLFHTRSSLFDEFQPDHEDSGEESVPWAFDNHPAIRNAYIHAFVGAAFEGMTRSAVAIMLDGSQLLLQSAQSACRIQGPLEFCKDFTDCREASQCFH